MIDTLTPAKKMRVSLLIVFALLFSLVGVSTATASAGAVTAYGGVHIVDSDGRSVGNGILLLTGDGWPNDGNRAAVTLSADGEARFGDAWNASELSGQEFAVGIDYRPISAPEVDYIWNGSPTLTVGDPASGSARAVFDADSTQLLELVLPVTQPSGSISGIRTLNPAGPGAEGAILLYSAGGDEFVASRWVGGNGSYTFPGVPDGSYKLQFSGNITGHSSPYTYVDAWYRNSRTAESATVVEVHGGVITNVDQTLQAYGSIRGVVGADIQDLEAPAVAVYPGSWNSVADWDSPEIQWYGPWDNRYSTKVEPGSYRVAFGSRTTSTSVDDEWGIDYHFTPVEYYGGTNVATSTVLTIAPGQQVTANTGGTPTFRDVAPGSQFGYEIAWLAASGVTTGYADGGFHPLATVNRDAMAAFLYRYAGSPAFTPPATSPFVDVPTSNQFYKEITWLASTGISTGWNVGSGKEFRPLATVARDAMAAFLYRYFYGDGVSWWESPATSPFVDVPTTSQFYKEITWLAARGVTTGYPDGTFRPLGTVNRDAMAAFLYRF